MEVFDCYFPNIKTASICHRTNDEKCREISDADCVSDIIASGIQQEQNSESTDVDEPFSPSTNETFDIDSASPQTFSTMSDSAQSDRQHGALAAETAPVDAAAEVDLVDCTSTSLLLQSSDVAASEQTGDEPTAAKADQIPPVISETVLPTIEMKEKPEVKDHALLDNESSQEKYLQSVTESHQDTIHEEVMDADQLLEGAAEDVTHIQSDDEQKTDASGFVHRDTPRLDETTDTSTKQSPSAGRAALESDVTYRFFVDVVTTDFDSESQSEPADEQRKQTAHHADIYSVDDFRKTVEEEEEEKVHYVAQEDLSYEEEVSADAKQEIAEHTVGIIEAQGDRELHEDKQKKCTEIIPQISISMISFGSAEDDDYVPNVEHTCIATSEFEEDTSYKDKVEEAECVDTTDLSAYTATSLDAELLRTDNQDEPEQLHDYHLERETVGMISDHQTVVTTESLLLIEPSDVETGRDSIDDIRTDIEPKEEPEFQTKEPATPEVERNLSHYPSEMKNETQDESFAAECETHDRKEHTESLPEVQQLHDIKLLCSSSESMVSSTTSDWTVIDTREEFESISAIVTDTQQQRVDESSTLAQSAVSQESRRDVFEGKAEAFIGGLDDTVEDEDQETDAVEDYLTATVTPTVDLMVMSTALESILEEEERTSSSQKTTSSSEKLEHDVSDSSKLIGSSSDMQHSSESPTAGKCAGAGGKLSDRDDVSVSSSLAEFERLERELQEKGSSESFSGDKGSSGSASAAFLPESPQCKSSTSLSSSLAEFERIEHEILGQSGSLEVITVDRKSHHTDSSSFSELERIEEMDKDGTATEEQLRSSSGSLAEFEYIEHQLRLNEELESEALKVATLLETNRISSAEKSPEPGSSQSDVRLSKEQIPESVENVGLLAEETAQPAAATEAQYPHYQDIVHIIREASKNVQTFQFDDHEFTSHTSATETVSQVDDITSLQQEVRTSELFHAETSSEKITSFEVSATAVETSTESMWTQEHKVIEQTSTLDFSHELERDKTAESQTLEHEVTDLQSEEKTDVSISDVITSEETVGEFLEPTDQQRDNIDPLMLSTDSLVEIQSEDVMQLSTDSLQPDASRTTSADVHHSSTSTLGSATTVLAGDRDDDEAGCLMERSTDSLDSDSREPSGEWVTVFEADSAQERHEKKSAAGDAMTDSTDSLEVQLGAESGQQLVGDEAGVVSGSASYESFEADSLQDEVEEEPTLVSSQSQDSLLVAGAATTPMDISFGSSGAWSQSTMSSCTTLASSSDGETLACSADVSTASSGAAAERRRLSEPSSGRPPSAWSTSAVDNTTTTILDSEGNILLAAVSDMPRTQRDDVSVALDNRQSSVSDSADKQLVSQAVEQRPVETTGHHQQFADEPQVGEASAAVDVPTGIF